MKRIIAMFITTTILLTSFSSAKAPDNIQAKSLGVKQKEVIVRECSISRPQPRIEETIVEVAGEIREVEYPEAEFIWTYLHDIGFNDYVSAGIIGNMMVEAGGYTLSIQPEIETKTYYGICQWAKKYYPDVIGVSLEEQCDYLRDTIQYEIDTFGSCYGKGFNYEAFLALENERDIALAFAKCYERCGSGSYTLRQDCAEDALKYFIELGVPGSTET